MVQGELRNKSTGDNPQQLNYAVGRLVAATVYCLKNKFESIGQFISTVYMEV